MVKDTTAFNRGFVHTISCSHPCNRGLYKYGVREYPLNCGYCFPCLVRKVLCWMLTHRMKDIGKNVSLDFVKRYSNSDIVNDISAVISSIYRYKDLNDCEIKRLITRTGKLSNDDTKKFMRVYKKTMKDLIELFTSDPRMKEYIGL